MRMLVVIYGGPRPDLVPDLLNREGAIGWTQLSNAHGAGRSGRHEGTRAWPGESQVFFTVAEDAAIHALSGVLRDLAGSARPGERLHVAELPVEQFF
jgi:hypothetical protein